MSEINGAMKASARKAFVKPEIRVLDVKSTKSGPFPDPFEFPMILQAS